MSEDNGEMGPEKPEKIPTGTLLQDDVVQQTGARALHRAERAPKTSECEIPTKKRKTRRGKSKRRYPYQKNGRKSNEVIKPEAPYNSNQFLLEDHGDIQELDENLKNADQISTASAGRTRDSSFSSDNEFYSSPDDEEQFLIKDFVDQYETVQAERLHSMSKDELIQEYLILETKLEQLTKRKTGGAEQNLQEEVERLSLENEALKRENALLKTKAAATDSEDSETDSKDSCSTSSSSSAGSPSPTEPWNVLDTALRVNPPGSNCDNRKDLVESRSNSSCSVVGGNENDVLYPYRATNGLASPKTV